MPDAMSSAHDQEENALSPAFCRCGSSEIRAKAPNLPFSILRKQKFWRCRVWQNRCPYPHREGTELHGAVPRQQRSDKLLHFLRTLLSRIRHAAWLLPPFVGHPDHISLETSTNHRPLLSFLLGHQRRTRRNECVFFVTCINIIIFFARICLERWTIAASCEQT